MTDTELRIIDLGYAREILPEAPELPDRWYQEPPEDIPPDPWMCAGLYAVQRCRVKTRVEKRPRSRTRKRSRIVAAALIVLGAAAATAAGAAAATIWRSDPVTISIDAVGSEAAATYEAPAADAAEGSLGTLTLSRGDFGFEVQHGDQVSVIFDPAGFVSCRSVRDGVERSDGCGFTSSGRNQILFELTRSEKVGNPGTVAARIEVHR